jgi:hypothetical protein
MNIMTKYRIVLDVVAEGAAIYPRVNADDRVSFEQTEDMHPTRVSMSRDVWVEMGSPKTVTLTLRSGDRLNVPRTGEPKCADPACCS